MWLMHAAAMQHAGLIVRAIESDRWLQKKNSPNNGFQIIHAWNSAPHAWAPATMAFKKPMPPVHGPFPLSFASSHNGCQEQIMYGKGPVRGTESTMHGPISFVAKPHGYQ